MRLLITFLKALRDHPGLPVLLGVPAIQAACPCGCDILVFSVLRGLVKDKWLIAYRPVLIYRIDGKCRSIYLLAACNVYL